MYAIINSIKYDNINFNENYITDDIIEKKIDLKFNNPIEMKNEFKRITSIIDNLEIQIFTSKDLLIDNYSDLKSNFVISNNMNEENFDIYLSLLTTISGEKLWE